MKLKYSIDSRKIKTSIYDRLASKAIIFIMYTDLWSKDGKKHWFIIPESCRAYKAISLNFETISEIKFVRVPSRITTEEEVSKFYKNYWNRDKFIKKGVLMGIGAAAVAGIGFARKREITLK